MVSTPASEIDVVRAFLTLWSASCITEMTGRAQHHSWTISIHAASDRAGSTLAHQRELKGAWGDEGAERRADADPARSGNQNLGQAWSARPAFVQLSAARITGGHSLRVQTSADRPKHAVSSPAERLHCNAAWRRFCAPRPRHCCHETDEHAQPHVELHCVSVCRSLRRRGVQSYSFALAG